MSDKETNVTPIGAGRVGTNAPKQHGRAHSKLLHRQALEDENEKLQTELQELKEKHETLQQHYVSLGAVAHALVLRHGKQVFSLKDLEEQCSITALRWGRVGDDRVELDLAVQPVPPEGKVR